MIGNDMQMIDFARHFPRVPLCNMQRRVARRPVNETFRNPKMLWISGPHAGVAHMADATAAESIPAASDDNNAEAVEPEGEAA